MKVFQYLAVYKPDADSKDKPEIIVPVTTVLAKDERAAGLAAARALPEGYDDKLDLVEVVVRPF